MDADTRHQLKQNELAQALSWLRNLNDTRTRYLMLGVALVLVLVLAGLSWYRSRRNAVAQNWQSLGSAVMVDVSSATPEKVTAAQEQLRRLIADSSNPNVIGYAKLNLAKISTDLALADPGQRPKGFQDAAQTLEEVNREANIDPMLRAAAMFALATNYESLHKPDQAKDLYTSLTSDTRFDGSPFKTQAAERLKTLDAATATVTFVAGAAPTQPAPAPTATPMPTFLNEPGKAAVIPPGETTAVPPPAPAPSTPPAPAAPTPPPAGQTPPPAPAAPPATQPAGQTP